MVWGSRLLLLGDWVLFGRAPCTSRFGGTRCDVGARIAANQLAQHCAIRQRALLQPFGKRCTVRERPLL